MHVLDIKSHLKIKCKHTFQIDDLMFKVSDV